VQWDFFPPGAKLARHRKAKPVLVGAGTVMFSHAGTGSLAIRLTPAGKRLLRHGKRLRIEAKATFKSGHGAATSVVKEFGLGW
jgi:hypothetical protein